MRLKFIVNSIAQITCHFTLQHLKGLCCLEKNPNTKTIYCTSNRFIIRYRPKAGSGWIKHLTQNKCVFLCRNKMRLLVLDKHVCQIYLIKNEKCWLEITLSWLDWHQINGQVTTVEKNPVLKTFFLVKNYRISRVKELPTKLFSTHEINILVWFVFIPVSINCLAL